MKSIFKLVLLLNLVFTLSMANAQVVECGNASATISNVLCADDVVTFTVTGTNTCTAQLSNLPMGFNFTEVAPGNNPPFIANATTLFFYNGSIANINAPLPGCIPLNLSITLCQNSGNEFCTTNLVILNRAIPTIGQWGLIILGFLILIVGISQVKKRTLAEI